MTGAKEVQPIIFAEQHLISQADDMFERDWEVKPGRACEGIPVESFGTVEVAVIQPL
jgi:hypothetical protein